MASTQFTIKYTMAGTSGVRDRPSFNFEFPQTLYVLLN